MLGVTVNLLALSVDATVVAGSGRELLPQAVDGYTGTSRLERAETALVRVKKGRYSCNSFFLPGGGLRGLMNEEAEGSWNFKGVCRCCNTARQELAWEGCSR